MSFPYFLLTVYDKFNQKSTKILIYFKRISTKLGQGQLFVQILVTHQKSNVRIPPLAEQMSCNTEAVYDSH